MADETETREADPVETAKDELRAEAERVAEAEAIAHAEGVAEAEAEATARATRDELLSQIGSHDAALTEIRENIDRCTARIDELMTRLESFEDEAPEIVAASELAAVDVAEAIAAETPPEHVEESDARHGKRKFVGLFRE